MLVSPLLPSPRFDEGTSYRPAKDLDAFNKLLPPPIEFVEGSSSGSLAVAEGKYPAINEVQKSTDTQDPHDQKRTVSTAPTKSPKAAQNAAAVNKMLPDIPIDTAWPSGYTIGSGLHNTGNTCFLNSALQCLLHTPPLLHVLLKHSKSEPCRVKGLFCVACSLRQVMCEAFAKPHSITPYPVITKLQAIAKHMRRGRQEDSHEFLRYFVDALQRSSLAGLPVKADPKLADRTWVQKIFGGLLRSRVKCLSCGHNSDTFDRMLDLSVDIAGVSTLKDALRKFVAVDHLRGADKYKCEKCKKPVNADKQFTIDEAPLVLTLHLKRFSPMGRKIPHPVSYQERLTLQPYMSEGKFGPSYTLYGVISHAGSGPNSGHYYAHVKGANGSWYEMNDDSVMRQSSAPTSMRSAYILFYIREKGQALEAAVNTKTAAATTAATPPPVPPKTGIVANMKKRKVVESEDEEESPKRAKTPRKFIGPQLPTPPPQTPAKDRPKAADPQSEALKRKIAAAASQSAKGALQSLGQYGDEDEDDDVGEKVPEKEPQQKNDKSDGGASAAPPSKEGNTDSAPAPSPTPTSATLSSTTENPIPPTSFYGTPASKPNDRKRKSPDGDEDDPSFSEWARTPISPPSSKKKERRQSFTSRLGGGNPFNRLKGSNNLKERRDSSNSSAGRSRKKRFLM
ncbi:cysteine proteinase [Trametes sanguinea]|nr:cysteine proteinase [Trametes sanguinea]